MILLVQMLAPMFVILSFRYLPLNIASPLAGSIFLSVSIYSIYWSYKKRGILSIGFYLWLLFLIFFALPIFISRIYYGDLPTSEIFIGFIPFEKIHQASEKVYALAFLGSLIDYWRSRRRKAT